MATGIVSYGVYIPRFRIRLEEIARVWGDGEEISEGLRVLEKSVPDLDEDTVTIAVEAARNALQRCGADPKRIGAIYAGSESHPYAVKPTATIVGQAVCSNTGKPALYFGEIYVRLGELYAQEGDAKSAKDVLTSVAQLFPNRPDLIQRAEKDLQALGPS